MEILKQLNLNGNPQSVPNGSLVFAKNIKVSDDGTYITNDNGFVVPFTSSEQGVDIEDLKVNNVVGTILYVTYNVSEDKYYFDNEVWEEYVEKDNEIVTITKTRHYNEVNFVGHINCPNEIVFFVKADCTVSYTDEQEEEQSYNEEPSFIIRAVEHKTTDELTLFKVPTNWKYDGGDIVGTYTYNVYGHLIIAIAEYNSDIDKQLLTIDLNKSTENDSLNEYSCAPNIPIANLSLNGKIKGVAIPHGLYYFFIRYEISDKLYTNWFPIGAPQYALSLDYKTIINHKYKSGEGLNMTKATALVNTNKDSYYNFNFTINFNETYNYKGYQIGYILQTEDTVVARIWNNFNFNKLANSFVFNGGYIEESSIDDFTKNVLNLYNVKSLTSYNNKLYIANFKETNYNVDLQEYANKITAKQVYHKVDLDSVEKESTIMTTWTFKVNNDECTITLPADKTEIYVTEFNDLFGKIFINCDEYWKVDGDNWIERTIGKKARLILNTEKLDIIPESNITVDEREVDGMFGIYGGRYRFGQPYPYSGAQGGFSRPGLNIMINKIQISKKDTINNYSTYNTDNVIRTLMPFEVYAFYVHYVRADGSFTNGLPLNNKATIDEIEDKFNKKIGALSSEELQSLKLYGYDLTDIATIDEIKDKFVYELYMPSTLDTSTLTENFIPFESSDGRILFRTGSGLITHLGNTSLLRIGVRFEGIEYPEGYVGCFFSYEKPQNISAYQGVVTDNFSENGNILIKANEPESVNTRYDGTLFMPHHKINSNGEIESVADNPYYAYINSAAPVLSNATITFMQGSIIDRSGLHGGIAMNLSKDNDNIYQPSEFVVGSIINFNRSIYSADVKELIPFGPIISSNNDWYGEEIDPNDKKINYDINYPSFITKDNLLLYKERIFIDEELRPLKVENNIINPDVAYEGADYAEVKPIWKFSNLNLLALTFKKEPENKVGVYDNNKNTINTVVNPVNASDLFKLESCYIPQIHKAYTNYNKYLESVDEFTNIIRVTYPIRTESGLNSWRLLDYDNYHVINNNNGEIVNLFGASTHFFIHCKNNLLITSSNAKITADNTTIHLQQNNIFDVEPTEVFTSDLGYGGLKYQSCQLFSQFGYIWYDTDRHKLFRWDGGKLVDICSGIDEILKKYNFEYCYVNIDNKSNRIFFCFDTGIDNEEDDEHYGNKYFTLSYNTISNNWLSIHDFYFSKNTHTLNKILFSHKNSIYGYDTNKNNIVSNKLSFVNINFPYYYKSIPRRPQVNYGVCFDIIFNESYNIPKVLDSITWIHEIIENNVIDENHPAQLKLQYQTIDNKVEDIKDAQLIVYTDNTDSGLLSLYSSKLNDVANVNNPNGYKYPYYNKGVWNLSYFRNNITTPVTDEELNTLSEQYGVPVETLKNVYKITDKNGNTIYINNVPQYRQSDLRSLIYGKYIAVRFIFYPEYKLKFDNLTFNLQKY